MDPDGQICHVIFLLVCLRSQPPFMIPHTVCQHQQQSRPAKTSVAPRGGEMTELILDRAVFSKWKICTQSRAIKKHIVINLSSTLILAILLRERLV